MHGFRHGHGPIDACHAMAVFADSSLIRGMCAQYHLLRGLYSRRPDHCATKNAVCLFSTFVLQNMPKEATDCLNLITSCVSKQAKFFIELIFSYILLSFGHRDLQVYTATLQITPNSEAKATKVNLITFT